MKSLSTALTLIVACLTSPALDGAEPEASAGAIEVQVTGYLNSIGVHEKGKAKWTFTYYVQAEGRDILLDCRKDAAALKILDKTWEGRQDPFTDGVLPVHTIKIKGRLKFRPEATPGEPKPGTEKGAIVPVIVVESLKVVDSSF